MAKQRVLLDKSGNASVGPGLITDSSGATLFTPGPEALEGDVGPLEPLPGLKTKPGQATVGPDGNVVLNTGLKIDPNSAINRAAQAARMSEADAFAKTLELGREREEAARTAGWVNPNLPRSSWPMSQGVPGGWVDPNSPQWETEANQGKPAQQLMEEATKPGPAFKPDPVSGPAPATDFGKAYEGAGYTDFYGNQYEGITGAQQNVIDVRATQPTNETSLDYSREKEGLVQSMAQLDAARAERQKLEAEIMQVENDVGREFRGGGTAAQHRAEVNNRIRQLKPVYDEVLLREQSAIADLNTRNELVKQRYGAVRADAQEQVDRAMQRLGFKIDNVNMASTMMANMKDFEIKSDALVTEKQTRARADFAVYAATPEFLKEMSPEARLDLQKRGNFTPGFIDYVADMKVKPEYAGFDKDSGNYVTVFREPKSGSISVNAVQAFVPTSTISSATIQAAQDITKASEGFKAAWPLAFASVVQVAQQSKYDPSAVTQAVTIATGKLAQVADPTNTADQANVMKFRSAWPTGGMTPADLAAVGQMLGVAR